MPQKARIRPSPIHIYTQRHWQIHYVLDSARFLHALPSVMPFGGILVFEGYRRAPAFRSFLKQFAAGETVDYFKSIDMWSEQIRFTDKFAAAFSEFQYYHSRQDRFEHLYGFSPKHQMVFWFHDAFSGGDLAVAKTISEKRIRRLCEALGPQYARTEAIC